MSEPVKDMKITDAREADIRVFNAQRGQRGLKAAELFAWMIEKLFGKG